MERARDDFLDFISFIGMIVLMPLFIVCWAVDMSVKMKMHKEDGME